MNQEDVKQRIQDYQQAGGVHPLICGNNASTRNYILRFLNKDWFFFVRTAAIRRLTSLISFSMMVFLSGCEV